MVNWHGFDPTFSTLPILFDVEAVAQLFSPHRLAATTDQERIAALVLQRCVRREIDYRPPTRCLATYTLTLADGAGQTSTTTGVVAITAQGTHCYLYTEDQQLPWLPHALKPVTMQARLQELLPPPQRIEHCTVTPIRYKPADRCTLRYDLTTTAGETSLFGKLWATADHQIMDNLTTLSTMLASTSAPLRIPQPLAYWPEWHMLLQRAVPAGTELHRAGFDPKQASSVREAWFYAAGMATATLHNLPSIGSQRTCLADDVKLLDEYLAAMQQAMPTLVPAYLDAVTALGVAASQAELPFVPSHGALRTDQFLFDPQGHFYLIDLDSFCESSPARDLGNFLAYLHWKARRQPQDAAFIQRAGTTFLEGYASTRPLPPAAWLNRYQATSLLKIAGRRFRALAHTEWPLLPHLLQEVHDLLSPNAIAVWQIES
ncbi:MAG: hypothetical protein R3C14_24105 [Caldilineaceae bacterium]